jgi:wyosine [tRNA(Phe)-imidazoG37] synthetase (radical SAM superfamily)
MSNKCVLPFINNDYQSNSPCCLLNDFKTNRDTQELLDDHRNNRRSKFCDACWKSEDLGIISKRQISNETNKESLAQTERSVSTAVIPVGNLCNLYCVTCGPGCSTSWLKKYPRVYGDQLPKNDGVIMNIRASDIRDIEKIKHIEFIGGETLKSASLWKYLEVLDKEKPFSLQTNGTVELTHKQIDLLSSFKNFHICFSLDGHGKIFEYLRQPAKWDKVQENIKQYIKNFGINRLSTYVTISNLNIFYIDEIVFNIFKAVPSRIELNLVHYPVQFAYDNLSNRVGIEVEKNNPGFFKNKKIEWRGTFSSLASMINNLERQDKFSKLKFEDHLPDFFNVLNEKPPTS